MHNQLPEVTAESLHQSETDHKLQPGVTAESSQNHRKRCNKSLNVRAQVMKPVLWIGNNEFKSPNVRAHMVQPFNVRTQINNKSFNVRTQTNNNKSFNVRTQMFKSPNVRAQMVQPLNVRALAM